MANPDSARGRRRRDRAPGRRRLPRPPAGLGDGCTRWPWGERISAWTARQPMAVFKARRSASLLGGVAIRLLDPTLGQNGSGEQRRRLPGVGTDAQASSPPARCGSAVPRHRVAHHQFDDPGVQLRFPSARAANRARPPPDGHRQASSVPCPGGPATAPVRPVGSAATWPPTTGAAVVMRLHPNPSGHRPARLGAGLGPHSAAAFGAAPSAAVIWR